MNKTCPICGNQLPRPAHGVQKYCSTECKRLGRNKRIRENRKPVWEYETRNCLVCGKEFLAKRIDYVFCSPKCKQKYHDVKRTAGFTVFTCPMCGKEFFGGGKGPRLYCSDECREKAKRGYYDNLHIRLHKCHNPMCSHKTREYYCSICRQKMRGYATRDK